MVRRNLNLNLNHVEVIRFIRYMLASIDNVCC